MPLAYCSASTEIATGILLQYLLFREKHVVLLHPFNFLADYVYR